MKFKVPGAPKGKHRPKFSTINGFAQAIKVVSDVEYENIIKLLFGLAKAKDYDLFDKPIKMRIEAYFPIPKSFSKKQASAAVSGVLFPQKKPDADNIAKIVCDALNGVAYNDDTQVVSLTVLKKYAIEPRVEVEIELYKER